MTFITNIPTNLIMAFPLHASEISDKSGREKHVSGSVLAQMAFLFHASEISDPFLQSDTETDFPRPVRSAKRSRFAATVFV